MNAPQRHARGRHEYLLPLPMPARPGDPLRMGGPEPVREQTDGDRANKSSWRTWPRIAVALGVSAAATYGLVSFKHVGERGLEVQRGLAEITTAVAQQEALEYRAVSGIPVSEIEPKLAAVRADIDMSLRSASQFEAFPASRIRAVTGRYAQALDHQLSLLRAGDTAAAHEFGEEVVDPAHAMVSRTLADANVTVGARSRSAQRISDVGIVGVVLLALVLTLIADRFRRRADRRRRESATYQALHDPLTALPNRRLLVERVESALARRQTHGEDACLLYMDLDDFKVVNDTAGHLAGDDLLIEVTHRLRGGIYPTDTLCRLGGDEFAVLLNGADAEAGRGCGERLLGLVTGEYVVRDHRVWVSASIGVAVFDPAFTGAEDVLGAADQAMYVAKSRGKNQVLSHRDEMSVAAARRAQLTQALHTGLAAGELSVAYQPIIDLPTGRTVGVEALARWNSPVWGRIGPDEFIPIAETSGTIDDLGRMMLTAACRDIAALNEGRSGSLPPLRVAVNISSVQLRQDGTLLDDIAVALREGGIPAQLLTLEITEGSALSPDSLTTMVGVRDLGVGLSLDDFGTGFGSLAHLTSLPITQLKIDRRFVDGIDSGDPLAATIITLGQQLGLEVVAEGVETAPQLERLQELGCPRGQGSIFQRPVDIDTLTELLGSRHAGESIG